MTHSAPQLIPTHALETILNPIEHATGLSNAFYTEQRYFELERGRYGPVYPRTPACYGFSIIAKVKEGREEAVRAYGKTN